jgi:hypothetical protein
MYKLFLRNADNTELNQWWLNFIGESRFDDDNYLWSVENKLSEYGAIVDNEFFWHKQKNEFIKFDSEEDLTSFLLRWS